MALVFLLLLPVRPGHCWLLSSGLHFIFCSLFLLSYGLRRVGDCVYFAGIWAADKLEACWGEDPSRVVVDEMVGVWIPLLAVPDNDKWIWYVVAAFVLFRASTLPSHWASAKWRVSEVG